MDSLLRYYPLIIYILSSILLVILIIIGFKIIKTIDKTNEILDDAYNKTKSLNGFFHVIDKATDTLSNLSDSIVINITNVIGKLFHKKDKKEEEK